jgi:hypothetical protein
VGGEDLHGDIGAMFGLFRLRHVGGRGSLGVRLAFWRIHWETLVMLSWVSLRFASFEMTRSVEYEAIARSRRSSPQNTGFTQVLAMVRLDLVQRLRRSKKLVLENGISVRDSFCITGQQK